ncbi:MAG TPA: hypothetical protein VIA62_27360 [Thermoanaerobaculia bacterium]|jgi:hypothetical protein|nr:hypothetical protein [Thermoanaerobaculia bacterium]
MSNAVENKANTAMNPNYVSSTESAPDPGDTAPPDTDPGPVKG